jgi:hypothetical protein
MASRNQLDLFGNDQPELFDEEAPTAMAIPTGSARACSG